MTAGGQFMTLYGSNRHLYPVLAALLLCACARAPRKTPPSAPAPPVPAAEKKAPVAAVSPEDTQKVEGLYYKAVGAYSSNDMAGAEKYLNEISTLSPSYPPAAELREKVKSVSTVK